MEFPSRKTPNLCNAILSFKHFINIYKINVSLIIWDIWVNVYKSFHKNSFYNSKN